MKNALLIATACLLGLLSTTGASLPYPILPPLFAGVQTAGAADGLTNFLGLPPKLLFAIALMVNPVGLLIGTSVLGSLSDRYGRRPLLLATTVGVNKHALINLPNNKPNTTAGIKAIALMLSLLIIGLIAKFTQTYLKIKNNHVTDHKN